ncbi:hypothetical protein WAI453_009991 [Rhynchosporium graminicola]
MRFSSSCSHKAALSTSTFESQSQTPKTLLEHHRKSTKMSRPILLTRSQTAPQLPPLLFISPISPIKIPFNDPFSTPESKDDSQHPKTPYPDSTHPFTRSSSCLLTHSPHPQSQPQRHASWPRRRASFTSQTTTKSLPPPITTRPAHIFHRLRSSFSTFILTNRKEVCVEHKQKSMPNSGDAYLENEDGDMDTWDRGWERGYEGEKVEGAGHGEIEGKFADGTCLHLPPEVSMDRSEIEYLRRLERVALSARGKSAMV